MPTYVYKFVDTGETIEVQQTFDELPLTEATHPGTGEVLPVRRVFTPVGVTFKGGCFYKTDSRGKSGKSGAGSKAKDEKPSTTKESSSSDSSSKSKETSSATSGSSGD